LAVLFSGINPSLYSGAVGHHFARPGNRFWQALYGSGFTDRLLSPFEDRELLSFGLGITNLVRRSTRSASELGSGEIRAGMRRVERLAVRWAPEFVAVLGLSSYRTATGSRRAGVGPQRQTFARSRIWVLPNPSGLNAHYQLADLTRAFGSLYDATRLPAIRR